MAALSLRAISYVDGRRYVLLDMYTVRAVNVHCDRDMGIVATPRAARQK